MTNPLEARLRAAGPKAIQGLIDYLQALLTRMEDDTLLRDLVADGHRVGLPAVTASQRVQVAGAGQAKEGRSLEDWRPPGLAIMDAMMDRQDELDRARR